MKASVAPIAGEWRNCGLSAAPCRFFTPMSLHAVFHRNAATHYRLSVGDCDALYTASVRGLLRSLCSNPLPYSDASAPSTKLFLQILGILRLSLPWWFRFAAIAAPGLRFRLAVRRNDSAAPPGNLITFRSHKLYYHRGITSCRYLRLSLRKIFSSHFLPVGSQRNALDRIHSRVLPYAFIHLNPVRFF